MIESEAKQSSRKILDEYAKSDNQKCSKNKSAQNTMELSEAQITLLNTAVTDIEQQTYGKLDLYHYKLPLKRQFIAVQRTHRHIGECIWIRGRVHEVRVVSKKMVFIVLRHKIWSIQCVASTFSSDCEPDLIKYAKSLPIESIVDVFGRVKNINTPIESCTEQLELEVHRLYAISIRTANLPFLVRDADRSSKDGNWVQVDQDTRLDNRVIDLRTMAMQATVSITHATCQLFHEILNELRFTEIHSPKLLGGTSEGGSAVFKLKYFNRDACLAQSPQLYKQMAISGDLDRVYEIGPVFRAENSNTHRHLCEFTGVDMEMTIHNDYTEILDVIVRVFLYVFEGLEQRCKTEIETIYKQFPNHDFRPLPNNSNSVLRFKFTEACELLHEAGQNIPEDLTEFDINTEQEKLLGQIISEKYGTDFYYITEYPTAVRAFYSLPMASNPKFCCSYDFFMRGEEILSGAQRIHDPEQLAAAASNKGILVETIKDYIDAFRYGAYPHGGCGIGLERVVMLFLGYSNIRKVSLFPRDPKRLTP